MPRCRESRWSFRPLRAMFSLLVFTMMSRLGEAAVPGPPSQADAASWCLGIGNPSGLQGKYHILSSVPADIFAISETHLSSSSRRGLTSSLKAMQSRYKHVLTGAPMAQRSTASDAGDWAGVAFTTTCPCRTPSVPWPPDVYETGRLQFGSFFTSSAWVTGAVLYGYPEGRNHPRAHEQTEALLDFAASHLLSFPGPKFFGGDWNFQLPDLAIVPVLRDRGWVEVQDLFHTMTGAPVQNTCRGATRKDFLWISPELAMALTSVQVCHETFADHSVILAHFTGGAQHLESFVWPCPKPVPWSDAHALSEAVKFEAPADPTAQYAKLWQLKENAAAATTPSWVPAMGGRGQQLHPKRKQGLPAPIKQGRKTDVQPGFHGFSALHVKQFRQLRRLQNYCRWISAFESSSQGDSIHGIGLWNAILRAPGFAPSFTCWWHERQYYSSLDPVDLPLFAPNSRVAHQIFEAVLAEVRAFERNLTAAQTSHRKAQHERDRQLIFREVARSPAAPVESLVHAVTSTVAQLDSAECAVELVDSVCLDASQPVWIGGQAKEVIHAEDDKIWISDLEGIQPTARVAQTRPIGRLKDLFEAFHEQWKLRWCRHDQLAFNHWDQLLGFARQVLRPHPVAPLSLDVPLLRAEVTRKKRRSATGLDGVSRADLLAADDAVYQSLISAYARAQSDGAWPTQLLAGKVVSLAKSDTASCVGDFRPITIFGLPYRLWSSLQARHLLAQSDGWVDDNVFGNRPGRQAADLWFHLLAQIEVAHSAQTPLSGLSADIEKCFNCIPRYPALCIAVMVGTPNAVTTAWAGALATMKRHFKVRESYSDGFLTSTGLAEGCGLSVFGMLLVDHLFACWMRAQCPAIRTLSYVDDWQTFSWDPAYAVNQLQLVEQFAGHLDLTIDRRKTFGWSTDPEVRQQLRAHGIQVLHHARELGSHMGVSRQYTNRTLTNRFLALDDLWPKLRSSKAGYHAKVYILRAVAWPRGLHAVASAPVGDSRWQELRRRATGALSMHRPGVNGHVLLGLVEAAVDPQYLGLLWTCREIRARGTLDFWAHSVAPFANGELDLPPNSLTSIVVGRLQHAGFSITEGGRVVDRFGSFCLHCTNSTEVELRLQRAWCFVVAARVSHRADFCGLEFVDLVATRKALHRLSKDDQALLRFSLAGGLFTESYKAKWIQQSDGCKYCGAPDSLHHRYWDCPQHADLRSKLAPDASSIVDLLPPALSLRGWSLLPSTWTSWLTTLAALSDQMPEPATALVPGVWNDVFTDGSCLWQNQPLIRVAAWSAVVARPFQAHWTPRAASVLGASVLSGLCQSAYCAELTALAFCLSCAARVRAPIRVWSDCLGVVNKFRLLVWGSGRIKPNKPNSDLWQWISDSVQTLGKELIQVKKVQAHRTLQSARTLHEAWAFYNNMVADRAARLANQARPTMFWQQWEQHVREVHAAEHLAEQVRALQLAVGRRHVWAASQSEDKVVTGPRETREFDTRFSVGAWTGAPPPAAARLFGSAHVSRVATWMWERLQSASGRLVWITFSQLYLDFQLAWNHPGPLRVQGQWIDTDQRKYIAAERYSFKQRARWFKQLVKAVWKEVGVDAALAQTRPEGQMVQAFLPAASLPWPQQSIDRVDAWLAAHLDGPCSRDAAALNRLPLAVSRDGTRTAMR